MQPEVIKLGLFVIMLWAAWYYVVAPKDSGRRQLSSGDMTTPAPTRSKKMTGGRYVNMAGSILLVFYGGIGIARVRNQLPIDIYVPLLVTIGVAALFTLMRLIQWSVEWWASLEKLLGRDLNRDGHIGHPPDKAPVDVVQFKPQQENKRVIPINSHLLSLAVIEHGQSKIDPRDMLYFLKKGRLVGYGRGSWVNQLPLPSTGHTMTKILWGDITDYLAEQGLYVKGNTQTKPHLTSNVDAIDEFVGLTRMIRSNKETEKRIPQPLVMSS